MNAPRPLATEARHSRVFEACLPAGKQRVSCADLHRVLKESGLRLADPRLSSLRVALQGFDLQESFDEAQFLDLTRSILLLLEAAVTENFVIPEFPELCRGLEEIFAASEQELGGDVANYIPQLGRVSPDQFGLAVCTVDGQRFSTGDSEVPFCIQSVCKPFNYCFALEELGEDAVHRHMGCEPSGVSFNELALNSAGLPHNPMINAGGIMSGALIRRGLPISDRFDHVLEQWARLAGGQSPGFHNPTYLSERATADRNFALGYSMREHGSFPARTDLVETLEFYFQCCALEMNADDLSVVAATLAGGGVCPLTGERVLAASTVQRCLSLMLSCGMYDYSGEWAFRIGLPAKSGVSGAVVTVIPNVMGICTWSPRLDAQGNSVRGIEFCRRLIEQYNFHQYDALGGGASHKLDPRRKRNAEQRELAADVCWAASEGDVEGIQRLAVRGADFNQGDYDGRTALHLAASEGRSRAVQMLLARGANPLQQDRWGNTPLDDARREGHSQVEQILDGSVVAEDVDELESLSATPATEGAELSSAGEG